MRGRLEQRRAVELRSVGVAGGIAARTGDGCLTVTHLRSAIDGSLGANRAGSVAVFFGIDRYSLKSVHGRCSVE